MDVIIIPLTIYPLSWLRLNSPQPGVTAAGSVLRRDSPASHTVDFREENRVAGG